MATKTVNYTEAQVAALREAAPLDMAKAKELAREMGKSYRSVIAKAKSENIEYVAKVAASKRVGGATKKEMIELLSDKSGVPYAKLEGLEKATAIAIAAILVAFPEPQTGDDS
jgi:O-acetyl-ADP-ribose deacetylase (regulator of RNase III)